MDEQMKALMDYTIFHIGLYTALCTLLVSIIGLSTFSEAAGGAKTPAIHRDQPLLPTTSRDPGLLRHRRGLRRSDRKQSASL